MARRSKDREFERISVSVGGKKTKFSIGDRIKFNEDDVTRYVTSISVDSDGCVTYQLTYLNDRNLATQWLSENDFNIMESLSRRTKTIGFK